MKKLLSILVVVFCAIVGCSAPGAELIDCPIVDELEAGMESGDQVFDHSGYTELLEAHVDSTAGTVDYAALQDDEEQLDAYLASLADVDLSELDGDEQLALLLNAYNAYTLKLILEHYPGIDSIRDISSPWTTERYDVGGYTLSLDQIEHGIIRPLYKDPRIHFVVNCAARSCPYLAEYAYTGEQLEEQLQERTEAILSDERFVRIEDDRLRYTKVMEWYESDFVDSSFTGHAPNVAQYIARYSSDEVRQFVESNDGDPRTSSLDYDWDLNDRNGG